MTGGAPIVIATSIPVKYTFWLLHASETFLRQRPVLVGRQSFLNVFMETLVH